MNKEKKVTNIFLKLCSRNKTKSNINKLLREDNTETSTQKEILD
jgi:hypothetical protein